MLPILEVDGTTLAQSRTVLRYVAREVGKLKAIANFGPLYSVYLYFMAVKINATSSHTLPGLVSSAVSYRFKIGGLCGVLYCGVWSGLVLACHVVSCRVVSCILYVVLCKKLKVKWCIYTAPFPYNMLKGALQ